MEARIGQPLDLSGPQIVPIAQVRSWAVGQGLEVGARGHLPESVIAAFNRRHRKVQAESKNPSRKGGA